MGNMMEEYVGWRSHREIRYLRRLMSLRHLSFLVEMASEGKRKHPTNFKLKHKKI